MHSRGVSCMGHSCGRDAVFLHRGGEPAGDVNGSEKEEHVLGALWALIFPIQRWGQMCQQ